MAKEARKAQRRAKTHLRVARRQATNNAMRMEAARKYEDELRANGFEYDVASASWVKAELLEAKRQAKEDLRDFAFWVKGDAEA